MLYVPPPPQNWISATELIPREIRQGWGELQTDHSVQGGPLRIAGRRFARGLGTHADSSVTFYLAGRCSRMQSWVGVDAEMSQYPKASVAFQVFLDGKKTYDSGIMRPKDDAKFIDLDVSRAIEARLVVTDAGDGNYADHADWADLKFLRSGATSPESWKGPSIQYPGIRASFADREGGLVVDLAGAKYRVATTIEGAAPQGLPRRLGQGVQLELVCANGRRVTQTQTLRRDAGGIAWTVRLDGDGVAFSAPIDTVFEPRTTYQVWMAGSRSSSWQDPLDFWRPEHELFRYGNRFDHAKGVSLPLASVVQSGQQRALLLAMSPADSLLEMDVATAPRALTFSRTMHRLQRGHPVVFHMHLVPVEPTSRAALSWITGRYARYFDPPNPRADRVGGLGAYSGYEGALDAQKYRAMGFKVNWKASIDFPYMGMFLPPVSPQTKWNRFAGGGSGAYGPADEGRYGQTSLAQLEAYNKRMRANDFEVLNYFNVTEFGGNITYPPAKAASGLWQDPEDFLFKEFPGAILLDPNPTWTWGGAVILDCGDPAYRRFLLDQAQRHLRYLPSNAGICIDRTDWLDRINSHANDNVTWARGPARSLLNSWKSLLDEMGPMMHSAGKVIFVNDLIRRLDIMRQVDGVYDEFGYIGGDLNTTAFLCLRKPHIAWTASESDLKPDPDAYMQRHLYMGAFPTAPVQANDHTIVPSAWADAQYLTYGPLFRALQQRKWDLRSGLAQVRGALVNVFSVPSGWVVPIAFAKGQRSIELTLSRRFGGVIRVQSLAPGDSTWKSLASSGARHYRVPVKRGCAMVRITPLRT